jgi:UDP-N-acetyl-D-mannosaminuronic acid transferase (WecB/TagA/CpsF family)
MRGDSGASLFFVGLGCPRQEVFAYEFRDALEIPILASGAAFPFLAGFVPQAPRWMQDRGLEWLFRLASEPRRLWRRYLYLNPAYAFLVALQISASHAFRRTDRLQEANFSTDKQPSRVSPPNESFARVVPR